MAVAATLATGAEPRQTMSAWTNGVWSLLPFMAAIVSWAIGRIVGAIMTKRVAYECREKDIKHSIHYSLRRLHEPHGVSRRKLLMSRADDGRSLTHPGGVPGLRP